MGPHTFQLARWPPRTMLTLTHDAKCTGAADEPELANSSLKESWAEALAWAHSHAIGFLQLAHISPLTTIWVAT